MKKVYILIGLPGCGKSTWSDNKLKKSKFPNPPTAVVSSDAIRGELYGDENVQGDPNVVFNTVKQRLADAVCGYYDNIILDATNLKKKDRIGIIKDLERRVRNSSKKTRDTEYEVIGVWFAVPVDECQRRNSERKRVVPKEVIDRMYKNFSPPGYEEGFDKIQIVFSDYDEGQYSVERFLEVADVFDQHNPHHTHTLGLHCRKTREYVDAHGGDETLSFAALIHDNGKLKTATYVNGKGETTDVQHFYQHHCVGAYDAAFYCKTKGFNDRGIVRVANLIYYHQHPMMQWKSEKAKKKDVERMPKKFYSELMLLHEGDRDAH